MKILLTGMTKPYTALLHIKENSSSSFSFFAEKLFTSIIRMKIGNYIFLANIPRFTTQKLARRCSELLLCNRNVFSSKVCLSEIELDYTVL